MIRFRRWLLWLGGFWLMAAAVAGVGVHAAEMRKVPIRIISAAEARQWMESRRAAQECLESSRIAEAEHISHQQVDFIMEDGQRYRLTFASPCPELNYYRGLYCQLGQKDRICAGRSQIMTRSGNSCQVGRITRVHPVTESKDKRN